MGFTVFFIVSGAKIIVIVVSYGQGMVLSFKISTLLAMFTSWQVGFQTLLPTATIYNMNPRQSHKLCSKIIFFNDDPPSSRVKPYSIMVHQLQCTKNIGRKMKIRFLHKNRRLLRYVIMQSEELLFQE